MNQMSNNQNQKSGISWPVIIIAFIFFWPLGIVLLILRSRNKTETYTIWKRTRVIGWILLIIGILFVIVFIADIADGYHYEHLGDVIFMLALGLGFAIGGIATLTTSKKQRAKSDRYKMYINFIINNEIEDIADIAHKMNISIAAVINELTTMISKGFLGTYIIDVKANRVFCPNKERIKQEEKERNTRVVICSNGCGASNVINTPVGRCEYCQSPIQ